MKQQRPAVILAELSAVLVVLGIANFSQSMTRDIFLYLLIPILFLPYLLLFCMASIMDYSACLCP